MGLIFKLSSQEEFPSPSGLSVELQAVIAHLVLFGTLALLLVLAFGHVRDRVRGFDAWIVAFVTLYGISDEFHQSFVPGRSSSVFDVIVDGLAAVLALVVLQRLRDWRRASG
jgi:VanZ family protein